MFINIYIFSRCLQGVSLKGEQVVEDCNTTMQQGISLHKQFTEEASSTVDDHLIGCGEWTKQSSSMVNSLHDNIVEFIEEDLKRDKPTGNWISFISKICI